MQIEHESLKYLFQQEYSKIVTVISKRYSLQHIEIVEDIVSETFLQAAESWGMNGLPPNPTAWLYVVAKQKTLYHFRRNKIYLNKIIPQLTPNEHEIQEDTELNFSSENIKDSQLQMLFAICHPVIASEAQIGLALRILCGFGIDEIAEIFFANKETINKRLYRAKEKLRDEKIKMELPSENEIDNRLDTVLHIIYLLFSEGYYSKTKNQILRQDLCFEALRLGIMLTEYERTNKPKTNALLALMCFHASRFAARQTNNDFLILYEKQDETLWNKELINQGMYFLNLSAQGNEISSYHLEAKIASWHCIKEDSKEKWEDILQLYNLLLQVNYSPSVALNRTYALAKANGKEEAIREAEKLNLTDSHFYYVLLGELYTSIDNQKARLHFAKAHALAKTSSDKLMIQKKINQLNH